MPSVGAYWQTPGQGWTAARMLNIFSVLSGNYLTKQMSVQSPQQALQVHVNRGGELDNVAVEDQGEAVSLSSDAAAVMASPELPSPLISI